MDFRDKAKVIVQQAIQGNIVSAVFGLFMGRCTFFAIVFSILGVYGWLVLNRDLTSFALFAGAIQALLVTRALGQDYHERQTQQQNTTVNISVPSSVDKSVV